MEVDDRCRCAVCGVSARASVELVRETFSASRTLEKTLEMLWGRFTDSEVDTKKIFERITEKRENWFCFPCLAVLHAGMGLVSEIMQLEERLRNLIGKITAEGARCIKDVPAKQKRDAIPKRRNREVDHGEETSEEHDNESQRMRGNFFREDSWNPTKRQSIKNKPMKKDSPSSVPLQSKSGPKTRKCMKIYGVEECPSCDHKVDIRSPEQAAVSSESLSRSGRVLLFAKSRYQMATHFRDVHLGVSGKKKFTQMNSSGRNYFKCIDCPFIRTHYRRVVDHYISNHVREPRKQMSMRRSSLSCPEEGCSFVSVGVKPGFTWTADADVQMRVNLSSHVIRYHDRLSLTAGKCQVNTPLLVETKDKKKEYQCTRCEYTKTHPETITNSESGIFRRIFLRHFFDVHLREMISNPLCVICSIPSRASVELVRETFSASRTLEKTLEMLWGRFTEVDTKKIFERITEKRGNLFCFPCVAVLHSGMGLVSEIMQLEERLRNLIGKITVDGALISYKVANISQDQQTNNSANNYEESKESAKGFKKATKKKIVKIQRNSCQEDSGNPTKSQSIKNKPVKKESARSILLKSKSGPKTRRNRKCLKIYGVENCPSCDYKVDVRSPEQAAVSSDTLSRLARNVLFSKSRYYLAAHFRDVHLGVSGMKKFTQMNSSGRKKYKCIECTFMGKHYLRVIEHYISIHVREPRKLVSTGRSSLSCPEEGCSFVSVAVKPGCTWRPNSDQSMRNNLSCHVIRYHDRLSLSAGKCQAHFPLVVETEDKSKEYQCTRCEYTKKLPEKCSNSMYVICYQIFLRHFFDVHLRELISNP